MVFSFEIMKVASVTFTLKFSIKPLFEAQEIQKLIACPNPTSSYHLDAIMPSGI